MKELGKIIAKNRKENKMKQGELAKKLESYDIFVKQNTISAWESGITQPSARQLLAICEILDIYDVYTEFIGQNPINPFRNLNEERITGAGGGTKAERHQNPGKNPAHRINRKRGKNI